MVQDYRALVNITNQQFLSKYPFEAVYQGVLPLAPAHRFTCSQDKLDTLRQHAMQVPGSQQKFAGLQVLFETYAKSLESKLINYDRHFMPGLLGKMTTDADFIRALVINQGQVITQGSRYFERSIPCLICNTTWILG